MVNEQEATGVWMLVIQLTAYGLLSILSLLCGVVAVAYFRALKSWPKARRLMPTHVILVTVGTLMLATIATTRTAAHPRPLWAVATFIAMGILNYSLWLVNREQISQFQDASAVCVLAKSRLELVNPGQGGGMADTDASKASAFGYEGSSPSLGTLDDNGGNLGDGKTPGSVDGD